MITLYCYPSLFGLPNMNPYGLKVDTFLRMTDIPYAACHIVDTSNVPRGQLPYLDDDGHIVSDSNKIIEYLTEKFEIGIDSTLTEQQKNCAFMLTRLLDEHLYWVIGYSRWHDERYWPLFKQALINENPDVPQQVLDAARKHNTDRYRSQGISRYDSELVYQMGIDDLNAIATLLGSQHFIFGDQIHTIDASCYGFLANIFYFDIDTPLKRTIISNRLLTNYLARVREKLNVI